MSDANESSRRSKSAIAANFSIIILVSYLVARQSQAHTDAAGHCNSDILPIRSPRQYLIGRYEFVAKFPLMAYAIILLIGSFVTYAVSILLYNNIDEFINEVNSPDGLGDQFNQKWDALGDYNLYGLEDFITSQQTIENLLDPETVQAFVTAILADLASFMTTMVTVAIFVIFLVMEEKSLPGRMKAAFPDSFNSLEKIVSNSSESISTYVISKATCSLGQAVILALMLYIAGIPGWFLFGTLCFLLDFIPVLGAILATIPPLIIALIVLDPWQALALGVAMLAKSAIVWVHNRAKPFRSEAGNIPSGT